MAPVLTIWLLVMNRPRACVPDRLRPTIQYNHTSQIFAAEKLSAAGLVSRARTRQINEVELSVGRRYAVGRLNDFTGHSHELLEACTRDNDRVATTMSFLSDTHETASFVFSKFNVEVLTLNLEFFRDDYVIHDDFGGDAT
jgi:hypothetical protein